MVAMNAKGETAIFPPVEMIFDPYLNLLDYQLSPAAIDQKAFWKVERMKIGFEAKRIFSNYTGLGNYGRFVVSALSANFSSNDFYGYPSYCCFLGSICMYDFSSTELFFADYLRKKLLVSKF